MTKSLDCKIGALGDVVDVVAAWETSNLLLFRISQYFFVVGDKFMYADLKNNDNVVKYGSIASPAVASGDSVSGDYCLRLWIFMESHGDTKVKLKWQEYPGGVETLLEQFVGDARPTWTAESIPFNTMKSFQVNCLWFTMVLCTFFNQKNAGGGNFTH